MNIKCADFSQCTMSSDTTSQTFPQAHILNYYSTPSPDSWDVKSGFVWSYVYTFNANVTVLPCWDQYEPNDMAIQSTSGVTTAVGLTLCPYSSWDYYTLPRLSNLVSWVVIDIPYATRWVPTYKAALCVRSCENTLPKNALA